VADRHHGDDLQAGRQDGGIDPVAQQAEQAVRCAGADDFRVPFQEFQRFRGRSKVTRTTAS